MASIQVNANLLLALAAGEARMRVRRLSTVLVLLAVIAISWSMIPDPHSASHLSLLTVGRAQVAYTSAALAFGSAKMAAILFGLTGFYLVRGRSAQDMRSGIGAVIGASGCGNAMLLASRWLGGVAYLLALCGALLASVVLCQLLRGVGPVNPGDYLLTYAAMLLPILFFAVSAALLCDSHARLMGKTGDILYFFLWAAQFPLADKFFSGVPHTSPWMLLDFSGLTATALALSAALLVPVKAISKGFTEFDPALPQVLLPAALWQGQLLAMRAGSAVTALLPLLPAWLLFHRFSPDALTPSSTRARRTPLAVLNDWLRPLSALARPLLRQAARWPGLAGQVGAEVGLTLIATPLAVALLVLVNGAALLLDAAALPLLMSVAVACWGVLVGELSVRDQSAATDALTAVTPGGAVRRIVCQLAASAMLGLAFTALIALRWGMHAPLRLAAVLAGLLCMSAVATLCGQAARSARLFLALFLFWLYLALNVPGLAWFDAFGFGGSANAASVLACAALGAAAAAGALLLARQRAR